MKISLPTQEEIRARAYQIYLARGCNHEHDSDDWLQAEYELMQLPLSKIAELDAIAVEGERVEIRRLAHLARAVLKSPKQFRPFGRQRRTYSTAEISSPA